MSHRTAQYRFEDAHPQYVLVARLLEELGGTVTDDERMTACVIFTVDDDFAKLGRHGKGRRNTQLRITQKWRLALRSRSEEELQDPDARKRLKDALQVIHRLMCKRAQHMVRST